ETTFTRNTGVSSMGATFVFAGCAVVSCGAAGAVGASWAKAHAANASTQSRLKTFFMESSRIFKTFHQTRRRSASVNPFTAGGQSESALSGITDRQSKVVFLIVLCNTKFLLHVFQSDVFGFGIEEENDEELQNGHGGEEHKWIRAGRGREYGKREGNGSVHEPVREAAQALPFGAHGVGKDFRQINPDDCALGKCEEGDVGNQY